MSENRQLRTGDSHEADLALLIDDIEFDHAVCAPVRIGISQEGVDDAENSAGGADPERERQDSGHHKSGVLTQLPKGEQQVFPHVVIETD